MSGIKPITREESFLAKMGGQDVVTPEPITRTEQFLQAIIDNGGGGGGGGTGGGVLVVSVDLDTGALDKTWNEIKNAPLAVIHSDMGPMGTLVWFVAGMMIMGSDYKIAAVTFSQDGDPAAAVYSTDDPDGYPVEEYDDQSDDDEPVI